MTDQFLNQIWFTDFADNRNPSDPKSAQELLLWRNLTRLGNLRIIVDDKDVTVNPAAKKIKDIKAAINTRITLWGKDAWIANVANAIENTVVEIDGDNPNRININPSFELSGVGRIFDLVNFVGSLLMLHLP